MAPFAGLTSRSYRVPAALAPRVPMMWFAEGAAGGHAPAPVTPRRDLLPLPFVWGVIIIASAALVSLIANAILHSGGPEPTATMPLLAARLTEAAATRAAAGITPVTVATPPGHVPTATTAPVTTLPPAPAPATPTPSGELLAAPVLSEPAPGVAVTMPVHFAWQWPEALAADSFFELRLGPAGETRVAVAWLRDPSGVVPALVPGTYVWSVIVVRQAGKAADGTTLWQPVSHESEERSFSIGHTASSEAAPAFTPPTPAASGEASLPISTQQRQAGSVAGLVALGLLAGVALVPRNTS
ncbi:MAG: hypothetical protein ACUVX9_11375 [Anaerolineae bacterium]